MASGTSNEDSHSQSMAADSPISRFKAMVACSMLACCCHHARLSVKSAFSNCKRSKVVAAPVALRASIHCRRARETSIADKSTSLNAFCTSTPLYASIVAATVCSITRAAWPSACSTSRSNPRLLANIPSPSNSIQFN